MNGPVPGWSAGFASLDEELSLDALPVTGRFPDWLSGSLLRVGPARFEAGGRSVAHWFDGLAMLHRFGFERGRVSYRNRFLRSDAFEAVERTGRVAHSGFMTDPCRTLFGRVASWFGNDATDNANVAVALAGGVATAMTETPLAVEFDPDTLETLGRPAPGARSDAPGAHVGTAHPMRAGSRTYTYTVRMGRRSVYRVLVEERGARRVLAEIPCPRPAYMHSFGLSARHLVLAEWPLRVNPVRLKFSADPFIRNYRWEPALGTRLTVLDRTDGTVAARARAPARFAFHHVAAHETGGALAVDFVAYPDASIIEALGLERLRRGEPLDAVGTLVRARVPLGAGAGGGPVPDVALETLSDARLELPRIDERARAANRAPRAVWGVGLTRPGQFIDDLTRIGLGPDGAEVRVDKWHEPGRHPGEPVFVPRPGARGEGDGALLSLVLDAPANRSFLLALDARTLDELGRATLPHAVPFGFHGEHVPGAA